MSDQDTIAALQRSLADMTIQRDRLMCEVVHLVMAEEAAAKCGRIIDSLKREVEQAENERDQARAETIAALVGKASVDVANLARRVAERQRAACADAVSRIETGFNGKHVDDPEEVCRATPLVTEEQP